MKILYSWLKDYIEINRAPEELAQVFASIGIEVASVEKTGAHFTGVLAAEILKIDRHPNADKLSLVELNYGAGKTTVVCGAKNISVGLKVPLALVGAKLPDGTLKKAKIRGVESQGMICSARELGVPGGPEDGIMPLSPETSVGADAAGLFGEPDCLFELELSPNRGDLLSHLGVARELAAALGVEFKKPVLKGFSRQGSGPKIRIDYPDGCGRYIGVLIRNVSAAQSPDWLKRRLLAMGTNPKNALVDVTNYVLYAAGHPLHAFDLDKLSGPEITVRRASQGEKFTALSGQELSLCSEDIAIADSGRAVALGGVMGGLDSGVSDGTKNLLLESAWFDPVSINKTARRYAMRSEASLRFERGADIEGAEYAAGLACSLLLEICGGQAEASEFTDDYPRPYSPAPVEFTPEAINAILGSALPAERIEKVARALSPSAGTGAKPWRLTPPSYRRDISHKWDIAEEVARFCGYSEIPDSLRPCMVSLAETPAAQQWLERAGRLLLGLGFCEAKNYDFISGKELDTFSFKREAQPEVANPLSADWQYLRPSLIPCLLRTLRYNECRGISDLRVYEQGRIYSLDSSGMPRETQSLAGLIAGQLPEKLFWRPQETRQSDFYHLKGVVAQLLGDAPGVSVAAPESARPYLHPKLCLEISLAGKTAGYLGALHPAAAEAAGAKSREIWVFELAADILAAKFASSLKKEMRPVSNFPSSWRDISVLAGDSVPYERLAQTIAQAQSAVPVAVELADLYQGKGVPEGKKSLTFRLTFELPDRTLKDAEVDKAVADILRALSEKTGAVLRG